MKSKILVYDDNCPLYAWYSGLFVKWGFLDQEGRKAFSKLEPALLYQIDQDKSRNEIPLLDLNTGNVQYGIDALLDILGQKLPFIRSIGNIRPVKWFLKKLYKLVSYNRKVIVAKRCSAGSFDCAPDMNYFYRFLLLSICLVLNTLILFPLHEKVLSQLSYYELSSMELQMAHALLVCSNCLLASRFTKSGAFEYFGQVNMLATIAVILLLPLFLLTRINLPEIFTTAYLVLATVIIFKEYIRRMEYASIFKKHNWVVSINLVCLAGFLLFLFA